MPTPTPLGNLARQRRDWNIELLRYGSKQTTGTNNNLSDNYTLNNDANDGTWLAIWGVQAYYQGPNQLWQMVMFPGLATKPSPNLDFQLMLTAPNQPGYTALAHAIAPFTIGGGLLFLSNGIDWMMLPDAPLMIIPPGWAMVVFPQIWQGLLQPNSPSFVNFLWGPYQHGKTPRRAK